MEIGTSIINKRKSVIGQLTNQVQQLGKIPPQAVDIEEIILGALMLERDAINTAIEILQPHSFYKPEHQLIFESIKDLFGKSQPVDLITVTAHLRSKGNLEAAGGPLYLSELTNKVGSAANIEFYCRVVSEKYILRRLIEISTEIQDLAYDETSDVFELLNKAEQNLYSVTENNLKTSYSKIDVLASQAIAQIEEMKDMEGGITGVNTGFKELDNMLGGWQKSDLIILAARPGMGKTAMVLTLARNAAAHNKGVAIFSLEMSSLQLMLRLISAESEIESEKFKRGNLESHEMAQLYAKVQTLNNLPIFIDDTPALNIFELRAKCRRLKNQYDIEMIVIDYLQLMNGAKDNNKNSGNREQEISGISRALKQLAKELNVPVIALSQLSRAVESRASGSKKPILSDLRESGSIEQDADQVLFIYRPEYYKIDAWEDGTPTMGEAEIIVAKNRHGAISEVRLKFVGRYNKFTNLDTDFSNYSSNNSLGSLSTFGSNAGVNNQDGTFTIASKSNDEDDEVLPF